MKIKNTITLFTILAIAMIASGCQGGQQQDATTQGVYVGTQTLDIAYREGMPYSPVTKGDSVDIGVEVKNYGADDISNGKIMVEGITSTTVQVQTLTMEGKHTSGREYGGPDYITFSNIPIQGDQSIIVTACYPYKTILTKNICYDPTIGTQPRTEVCTFQQMNAITGGQGAPVAITNVQIDRRNSGKDAKLIMTIENKGTGGIRSPTSATADCDGRTPTPNEINRIRIDKVTFSGKTGNCNPAIGGMAVIEGGKTIVSCEFSDLGTTA
jgi:hypothetical protein